MADPLSISASIVALLQLSTTVVRFLRDVKDAPDGLKRLMLEVCSVKGLLSTLQDLVDSEEAGLETVQSPNVPNGPLEQYRSALEHLTKKLEPAAGFKKVKKALTRVTIDEEALADEYVLISVCAGLVTVGQESNIIRLVHYTTQEYFEHIRTARFPDAQASIAMAGLVYMSFNVFAEGCCKNDEEMEMRMQQYPFLGYAAQHWDDHARGDFEGVIEELALKFLTDNVKVMSSNQARTLQEPQFSGYRQRSLGTITGLHIAAAAGLEKIVQLLLGCEGVEPNSKDANEHEGVGAISKDNSGQTPLRWAAEKGHSTALRLLLERGGVDANIKDGYGWAQLSFAAWRGNEAVVQLLLEHEGINVDSRDNAGRTPLSQAAVRGHEKVVRLLLEHESVDPDSKDEDGWTPLSRAVVGDREVVVQLLLEKEGVDPDSKDNDGHTPLWWAAANGSDAAVRLLLESGGVNADFKGKGGLMPLALTAMKGHEAMVRLLLERGGVDVNSKDDNGHSALWWAAKSGSDAVVRWCGSWLRSPQTLDKGNVCLGFEGTHGCPGVRFCGDVVALHIT
ncbi:MAG: hypothetical protein M1839_001703 [Geoglossum umbratile]|nr:MAG: hypothetical protein M1839_001703 [Geoglossum umbratile]